MDERCLQVGMRPSFQWDEYGTLKVEIGAAWHRKALCIPKSAQLKARGEGVSMINFL